MIVQIVLILLHITSTQAFFTYSDCDDVCKTKHIGCSISEQAKKFFICHCYEKESVCEMLASSVVVCLTPDGAPSGGEEIWDDYEKRNSTTTESPMSSTPKPTTSRPEPSKPASRFKRIMLLISAAALVAITVVTVTLIVKRKMRRQGYSRLRPREDSLYQETVENIEE